MQPSTRWFGWIALIAPLHMSEQLLFGIGELAALKRILGVYYRWFQQPDYGTVVLVAVAGSLLFGLTYGILVGGLLKEISLSAWALIAIGEIHHIVESLRNLRRFASVLDCSGTQKESKFNRFRASSATNSGRVRSNASGGSLIRPNARTSE